MNFNSAPDHPRRSRRRVALGRFTGTFLSYLLIVAVALIFLVPFLWALAVSFTPLHSVFAHSLPFSWLALVPSDFTLQPYADLFARFGFLTGLRNSVILSCVTVGVGGLTSAFAGFAFARFEFPGKSILFGITLFTFMVPLEVIIIPLYVEMSHLGWMNTWQGLLLPGLANGLTIFLFRQFFAELPQALIDAAQVDGASWLRIFFQLILPLSRPVLISGAIVLFLDSWNSFFWPLTVTSSIDLRVVQMSVALTVGQNDQILWNVQMAGAILASLVPILLVLPFQRYFVKGITNSGLTG